MPAIRVGETGGKYLDTRCVRKVALMVVVEKRVILILKVKLVETEETVS